jgi:hypothetical protein
MLEGKMMRTVSVLISFQRKEAGVPPKGCAIALCHKKLNKKHPMIFIMAFDPLDENKFKR